MNTKVISWFWLWGQQNLESDKANWKSAKCFATYMWDQEGANHFQSQLCPDLCLLLVRMSAFSMSLQVSMEDKNHIKFGKRMASVKHAEKIIRFPLLVKINTWLKYWTSSLMDEHVVEFAIRYDHLWRQDNAFHLFFVCVCAAASRQPLGTIIWSWILVRILIIGDLNRKKGLVGSMTSDLNVNSLFAGDENDSAMQLNERTLLEASFGLFYQFVTLDFSKPCWTGTAHFPVP